MAVYATSINGNPGGGADTFDALYAINPSASVGMALVDTYASHVITAGSAGSRMDLFRATGGTANTLVAAEKMNSKSSAQAATCETSWIANANMPTKSGLSLVLLPWSVTPDIPSCRRWMPPHPRYPLLSSAGDNKVELWGGSGSVTYSRSITFAEPVQSSYRPIRGRRLRTARGFFDSSDQALNFCGLATAPVSITESASYRYVQSSDWHDPPDLAMGVFLNLLNFSLGTTYNDVLNEAMGLTDVIDATAAYTNAATESISLTDLLDTTGIFGHTLSESLALGDAQTTTAVFPNAVSEAVTPGDVFDVGVAFPISVTETLALGDSASTAVTFANALAEAIALSDSFSSTGTFGHTLSESVALGDSIAVSALFGSVLSEALTLNDSPATSVVFPGSFTELLTLGDVLSAVIGSGGTTYNDALAEALSLGDGLATTAVFVSPLAEALSLSDTLAPAANFPASMSEGMTLTDALSASVRFDFTMTESVTLGDALATSAQFAPTLTEGITLADSFTTTATFVSTVSDGVTLSDSLVYVYVPAGGGVTIIRPVFIWDD